MKRVKESIDKLVSIFASDGNGNVDAACDEDVSIFSAEEWNGMNEKEQQEVLL